MCWLASHQCCQILTHTAWRRTGVFQISQSTVGWLQGGDMCHTKGRLHTLSCGSQETERDREGKKKERAGNPSRPFRSLPKDLLLCPAPPPSCTVIQLIKGPPSSLPSECPYLHSRAFGGHFRSDHNSLRQAYLICRLRTEVSSY